MTGVPDTMRKQASLTRDPRELAKADSYNSLTTSREWQEQDRNVLHLPPTGGWVPILIPAEVLALIGVLCIVGEQDCKKGRGSWSIVIT